MLTAVSVNGKAVCLLDYHISDIKELQKYQWYCTACGSKMILKIGSIKQPHFAHLSLKACNVDQESESAAHLAYKERLYQWCQADELPVEMEKYLPNLAQIPDLLIAGRIAIEIQCSPLSIKRFKERTENYLRHGYQVVWLMGEKLHLKQKLSALQTEMCCFSLQSGVYFWEIHRFGLKLNELMIEDLAQHLFMKTRIFKFEQQPFLSALRAPFVQSTHQQHFIRFDYQKCQQIIQQSLFFAGKKWVGLQALCYQNGVVLQTLSEDFLFPGKFPLFYQPIQFRIRLRHFLEQLRTFAEVFELMAEQLRLPVQINAEKYLKALLAFELNRLAAQRQLLVTASGFQLKPSKHGLTMDSIKSPKAELKQLADLFKEEGLSGKREGNN
ncbi:MAG: hypothetical protein LBS33_04465 [Streptococcaceae bacterium]|nr:hypothetical protein [Streptococcaceae bacterium]